MKYDFTKLQKGRFTILISEKLIYVRDWIKKHEDA